MASQASPNFWGVLIFKKSFIDYFPKKKKILLLPGKGNREDPLPPPPFALMIINYLPYKQTQTTFGIRRKEGV